MPDSTAENGFTLVEVLIAMLVGAFIGATILSVYHTQSRVYTSQQAVVEMQQNARAALNQLAKDIRKAGYDPESSASAGFVDSSSFTSESGQVTVNTSKQDIAFTADISENGSIETSLSDADGDGSISVSDNEQIAYRLSAMASPNDSLYELQRFSAKADSGGVYWSPIAEYVQAIEFAYYAADGSVISDISSNLNNIARVTISLLFRAPSLDVKYSEDYSFTTASGDSTSPWSGNADHYRRFFITTSVDCRNRMSMFQ